MLEIIVALKRHANILVFYNTIANTTEEVFRGVIKGIKPDADDATCEEIHAIAVKLNSDPAKYPDGMIPTTLEGLKEIDVDESVAYTLLQSQFGVTGLYVSLNIRKMAVALDLIDWEEYCPTKSTIKMVAIKGEHVKASLLTWLPKGEVLAIQDAMDSIGRLVREENLYREMKKLIESKYGKKEKEMLHSMILAIVRFYKLTRGGKRRLTI